MENKECFELDFKGQHGFISITQLLNQLLKESVIEKWEATQGGGYKIYKKIK